MFLWALLPIQLTVAQPQRAVPANAVTALDGTWVSDCLPIGKGGRHGFVTTITFDRGQVEATSQVYARNTCDTRTFKVAYKGRVMRLRNLGDRFSLQHMALSVALTPQDPSVVEMYNRDGGGCGLQGWQIGAAKSVAGRSCGPFSFPKEQATLFDSIWSDGKGHIDFAAFPASWVDRPENVPARPSGHRFRRRPS